MGLIPMLWAKSAPAADTYERIILFTLAEAADNDGTGAWESIGTLAEIALCDTETIKRRLKAMVERGLIGRGDQRLVEHYRADRRPVVYDLLVPRSRFSDDDWHRYVVTKRSRAGQAAIAEADRPDIEALPEGETGRARRSDAGKPNPKRRPKKDPASAEALAKPSPTGALTESDGHGGSNRVDTGALTESNGGSVRAPNQSLNQSTQTSPKNTYAQPEQRSDDQEPSGELLLLPSPPGRPTDRFEEFWSHYPRKVDKQSAIKAWRKAVKRHSADHLISEIQRWAGLWQDAGTEKTFIMHAATWLNNERWTDEPPMPRLRAVSNGYTPFQNPADPVKAYSEGWS